MVAPLEQDTERLAAALWAHGVHVLRLPEAGPSAGPAISPSQLIVALTRHPEARFRDAVTGAVGLRDADVLVTLGDYVDRGPDSRGVLQWLIDFGHRGRLIAIRGNHDLMMMKAREGGSSASEWMDYGGDAALASYGGRLDLVPAAHWKFLEVTRLWHATDSHFFVHANAYPDYALEDQPEYMLLWETYTGGDPHVSGKTMVCGHTPQRSGRPRDYGHAVCIDTGACKGGWLTCLDVATRRYWQANERGELRDGWLGGWEAGLPSATDAR